MAIDTPVSSITPGLLSTSVRGNLLDLEHVWLDATGPASPFLPVPTHLKLIWHKGLPYWAFLNKQDFKNISQVTRTVEQLLKLQQTCLKWLSFETKVLPPVLF
jgi:hypothetical protein